jgi:hypothetical protein
MKSLLFSLLILVVVGAVFSAGPSVAEAQRADVQVKGLGDTPQEARNDALENAKPYEPYQIQWEEDYFDKVLQKYVWFLGITLG